MKNRDNKNVGFISKEVIDTEGKGSHEKTLLAARKETMSLGQ